MHIITSNTSFDFFNKVIFTFVLLSAFFLFPVFFLTLRHRLLSTSHPLVQKSLLYYFLWCVLVYYWLLVFLFFYELHSLPGTLGCQCFPVERNGWSSVGGSSGNRLTDLLGGMGTYQELVFAFEKHMMLLLLLFLQVGFKAQSFERFLILEPAFLKLFFFRFEFVFPHHLYVV